MLQFLIQRGSAQHGHSVLGVTGYSGNDGNERADMLYPTGWQ